MSAIPSYILKQLIADANLENLPDGFQFAIRNKIGSGTLTAFIRLEVDGVAIEPAHVFTGKGEPMMPAAEISWNKPLPFQHGEALTIKVTGQSLAPGEHKIALTVDIAEIGRVTLPLTLKL